MGTKNYLNVNLLKGIKMKAFKIKKKSHRHPTFIIGPSVTSFQKPNLPRYLFFKVNKPTFAPKFIFEPDQPEEEQLVRSQELQG